MKSRIHVELLKFKQKFWVVELIKGILIFSGTGVVWLFSVAVIEYFTWLDSSERAVLFWLTAFIVGGILIYYVIIPVINLIIRGKGLSDSKAAELIGEGIRAVDDRLVNYLELERAGRNNELIDASLAQKEAVLSRYPFSAALRFSNVKPFLFFLIIPGVLLLFFVTNNSWYIVQQGAERLLNYNVRYEKRFPFLVEFSKELKVNETASYDARVLFKGEVLPNGITIISEDSRVQFVQEVDGVYCLVFNRLTEDVAFRFMYDDSYSEQYILHVRKSPVIGRFGVIVSPPLYTSLEKFAIDNIREVTIPEGSEVELWYTFKNAAFLDLHVNGVKSGGRIKYALNDTVSFKLEHDVSIRAFSDSLALNEIDIRVKPDVIPDVSFVVDSILSDVEFKLSATDDYGLIQANLNVTWVDGKQDQVALRVMNGAVNAVINFTTDEVNKIREAEFYVIDAKQLSSKKILFTKNQNDKSNQSVLAGMGATIDDLKEDLSNYLRSSDKRLSNKMSDEKKRSALKSNLSLQELAKTDEVKFERIKSLSEDIEKLLDKLNEKATENEKRLTEKQLDEAINRLEKEWAILNALEDLEKLDEELVKEQIPDNALMQRLKEDKKNVNDALNEDEKERIELSAFDSIQQKQKQLRDLEELEDDQEEEKNNGLKDEDSSEDSTEREESPDGMKKELSKQMKEDSDALKLQLTEMSSMLAMEAMEKNIELIRRLEMRSLKLSKEQETVGEKVRDAQVFDIDVRRGQQEINRAARNILDSLSVLLVTDEMLAGVLNKNKGLLQEYIAEADNTTDVTLNKVISNQRYLQYSLNDLASVLYDILKSETMNMQSMMAGDKECNKPKSGKGKKKSLSKKQSEFGEKLGKMVTDGKGSKQSRKTLGNKEIMDLIRGQEEILNSIKENGSNGVADKALIEEINKQLDDLINLNLDKALERSKSIEEKLLLIEESENEKNELNEKRKSEESLMDYEAIQLKVNEFYLRGLQKNSRIVNLPALNFYYGNKWGKARIE